MDEISEKVLMYDEAHMRKTFAIEIKWGGKKIKQLE